MAGIRVKICGLRTPADVAAVARAGAAYAGFVFFAKSPRNLTLPEARLAAMAAPVGLARVVLTVDADDTTLDAIVEAVPLDILQLHGGESPGRGRRWLRPWMLAGGLTAENLAEAVRLTGARQVDVSSGVESAPGVKDPERIAAFVAAARHWKDRQDTRTNRPGTPSQP